MNESDDDIFFDCKDEINGFSSDTKICSSKIRIYDKTIKYNTHDIYIKNILSVKFYPFIFNNKIDREHIERLKDGILESTTFIDTIKIVNLEDILLIIDGHHRIRALFELYQEDKIEADMKLKVDVFDMIFINNDNNKYLLKLFEYINNTKPFKPDNMLNSLTHLFLDTIKKKELNNNNTYGVYIKANQNKDNLDYIKFPYIRPHYLVISLKEYLKQNNLYSEDDIQDTVDYVIKLNNNAAKKFDKKKGKLKYTNKKIEKYFSPSGKYKFDKLKERHKKCKEKYHGFYLGLFENTDLIFERIKEMYDTQ